MSVKLKCECVEVSGGRGCLVYGCVYVSVSAYVCVHSHSYSLYQIM